MLRLQDGTQEFDANDQGGGAEGNIGKILKPAQAELKFVGSQQGHAVVVMRTDRAEAAMAALESHHVNTLDPKDIYRI